MSYTTNKEFEHFDFSNSHVADLAIFNGNFNLCLDGVRILESNSANRDIRTMRTNGLTLKLADFQMISFTEEGYRKLDLAGHVMEEVADRDIPEGEQEEMLKQLIDGTLYEIRKEEDRFSLYFDALNERSYQLVLSAKSDSESWERFMNAGGDM